MQILFLIGKVLDSSENQIFKFFSDIFHENVKYHHLSYSQSASPIRICLEQMALF